MIALKISKAALMIVCTLSMFITTACHTSSENEKKNDRTEVSHHTTQDLAVPDSIVQFLVAAAAEDFNLHKPPTPIDFRNLRIGLLQSDNDQNQYVMCGEFLSKEKADTEEWETFATIKTSGYEQYVGMQAIPFCNNFSMVLTDASSLATALKNRHEEYAQGNNE
ncbi:MAG: hypothetical protein R2813_07920 [Flavobacteriales bacterium]